MRHGLTGRTNTAPRKARDTFIDTKKSPENSQKSDDSKAEEPGDTIPYALKQPLSNGERGKSFLVLLIRQY